MPAKRNLLAVILGGGAGTRLFPLTQQRSKPAVPVRQVLPHMADWGIDTLLILSGDHLYRMDYRDFLQRHYDSDADVTVSVIPCAAQAASEFGLLKTDQSGRIIEFKEKPKGDDLLSMQVDTTSLGRAADDAMSRPFL